MVARSLKDLEPFMEVSGSSNSTFCVLRTLGIMTAANFHLLLFVQVKSLDLPEAVLIADHGL